MLPEEVTLRLEILRAVGDALVYGKKKDAIIVVEDLTLYRRREGVWEFDAGNEFQEHGAEGQERTHCGAESGVFDLESGQEGDLALEVRLPQDGAPAKSDDVSSARLCRGWRTIWIASMEACEVGIYITVEVHVAGGLDNHTHFAGAMQIANKSLDGGGVTFLWAVTEPCDLADGKCDVGASVGGEVKQHTDNGAVAPGFFHGWSVGVNSESGLSSWRPIVIAVGHASCVLNLLNQTFLVRVSVPFAAFLVKLLPRKLVKLRPLDSRLEKSFLRSFLLLQAIPRLST
jgi:hypothetical protein